MMNKRFNLLTAKNKSPAIALKSLWCSIKAGLEIRIMNSNFVNTWH